MANSKIIMLPCADGSDPNCRGRVAAQDYSKKPFFDLTEEQQEKIADLADKCTEHGDKIEEEIDGIDVCIEPAVCSACGSDYRHEANGDLIYD